MYELVNVKNNTYYVNCPAKIGIYVDGNCAYLIDSGNDKDAGKKVKRILDEKGLTLKAIINTHAHADHIGGNNFLQKQTDCKIYAKGIEKAFTLSPILEPSFLGGSYPQKALFHKFLYAESSVCEDIESAVLPIGFEIVDLPGHSFEMIGVRTPDNVLFIGDSVSSGATIEKYGIGYTYNVSEFLDTLDKLDTLSASFFVPSHADVCEDLHEIVEINRKSVNSVCEQILSLLHEPKTFEDLLSCVFAVYNLTMTNEQYVLIGSTVKSYLSYLKDSGKVETSFENNYMLYKTV